MTHQYTYTDDYEDSKQPNKLMQTDKVEAAEIEKEKNRAV